MTPLRILMLSPVFPAPQNTGTRVRLHNLLRCLHDQGHELGFISFVTPEEDPWIKDVAPLFADMRLVPINRSSGVLAKMRRLCRALPHLLRGMPPLAAFADHKDIRNALLALAPRYDVLCVEFYFMASNVPSALLAAHKPLSVLVEHDLSFVPLQRRARLMGGVAGAAARFAAWVAKKTECGVLRRFTHIVAMSQHDAALLQGINPAADVWVVPNGVDCTSFRPTGPRSMPGNAPRLLFAGGLAHYPNLDAIRYFIADIWPGIRSALPQASLSITGSTEGIDVASLRQEGVHLTGFVPDIHPLYAASDMVICPYRIGGGTRLKIVEAMAAGVPVVSTRIGAEGIALEHEKHALLADAPSEFAEAVVRLARNPALAANLAANGRVLAEEYDWQRIAAAFVQKLQQGGSRG